MGMEDHWALAEEDLAPFRVHVHRLLRKSSAQTALLTDTAGHLQTFAGRRPEFDLQSFLVLVAGDYAAAREMANMMGEERFNALYHQSERHQIYITELSQTSLLVLMFDRESTLGLVRWAVKKYKKSLVESLDAAAVASRTRNEQASLSATPVDAGGVDDALDAFFDA